MKHSTLYTCSSLLSFRYSKRLLSGLLLISLLAVQVKIMLEGCLVMPYLPAQQSMAHTEGACAEPASPAERVCLANCEYSVSKPKPSGEIALLDVIVGSPMVMFVMGLFPSFSPHPSYAVFVLTIGPPLYLLFLRLFIPIPSSHH
ncbi:hypothetical protein [Nitrosomonas sp. Nm58]|uniref:hypothetical protein n=1 Tax=Nitrosomonas sp. Nm58 TaxID=200126 RepID=UPI00089CD008|nr:hypothetical protein [Nitrosomonas sp. Nm58]SDY17659.1 hypothetical protein SAMN05421754_10031 [Nitrosomonas sp. Nm58]